MSSANNFHRGQTDLTRQLEDPEPSAHQRDSGIELQDSAYASDNTTELQGSAYASGNTTGSSTPYGLYWENGSHLPLEEFKERMMPIQAPPRAIFERSITWADEPYPSVQQTLRRAVPRGVLPQSPLSFSPFGRHPLDEGPLPAPQPRRPTPMSFMRLESQVAFEAVSLGEQQVKDKPATPGMSRTSMETARSIGSLRTAPEHAGEQSILSAARIGAEIANIIAMPPPDYSEYHMGVIMHAADTRVPQGAAQQPAAVKSLDTIKGRKAFELGPDEIPTWICLNSSAELSRGAKAANHYRRLRKLASSERAHVRATLKAKLSAFGHLLLRMAAQ